MEYLKAIFGREQENIMDGLLSEEPLKSHLQKVEKEPAGDEIQYKIWFDDPYYFYLLGHMQASLTFRDVVEYITRNGAAAP